MRDTVANFDYHVVIKGGWVMPHPDEKLHGCTKIYCDYDDMQNHYGMQFFDAIYFFTDASVAIAFKLRFG